MHQQSPKLSQALQAWLPDTETAMLSLIIMQYIIEFLAKLLSHRYHGSTAMLAAAICPWMISNALCYIPAFVAAAIDWE